MLITKTLKVWMIYNDSSNIAINKYSENHAVAVGRIDRFMQIAIFSRNWLKVLRYSLPAQPSEENFAYFIRGKIIDQCLKIKTKSSRDFLASFIVLLFKV